LTHDPCNVEALVGAAYADYVRGAHILTDDRGAAFAAAEAISIRALALAPQHALAHLCLGRVEIQTNRAIQGIEECERALVLDRNLAAAHVVIGNGKMYLGRSEETEAHVDQALRLSPRDTNVHTWMNIAGVGKLLLGRNEEAAALLRRAVEINRNFPTAHFTLAAALAHLGRLNEARAATQAGLALNSNFTISRSRSVAASDNPIFLAQRERISDGMRKAGVPEG
jgi:tetratricopeptide (TPR) repeat protein